MAARRLPVELYSILNSSIPNNSQLIARSLSRQARLSSTVAAGPSHPALALSQSEPARAQPSTLPAAARAEPVPNLFESVDGEYSAVPLSTLDHPAPPRSATEALLSLLASNQFAEAEVLLTDLSTSHDHLEPDIAFANHARHLLESEPAASDAWLRWWALSPSVVDLHRGAHSARNFVARWTHAKKRAARRLTWLIQGEDTPLDFDQLERFARLLCAQGHTRLVALEVLPRFAAAAPAEQSERLWEACLDTYRTRPDPLELAAQASFLAGGSRKGRSVTRQRASIGSERQAPDSGDFSRRWFIAHQLDAAIALKRARAQMIRIHAGLGRLELAAQLALDSALGELPGSASRAHGSARVPAFTYVRLLALTAQANQFALFKRLYDAFVAGGRRLTRTQQAKLRQRMPYLARAANGADGTPAVKEAFTTFRYASFASSIEEGAAADEPLAAARRDGAMALHEALANDDVRAAGAILVRQLKQKIVLPLDVTAKFIAAARGTALEPVLENLDELFSTQREGIRSWMSGYWATATMLAANRDHDYDSALTLFFNLFSLDALPEQLTRARALLADDLDRWDIHTPGARKDKIARLVPDAHTFAIAIQALVPRLAQDSVAVDSDGRRQTQPSPHLALVDSLLDALLTGELAFPVRTRSLDMTTDGKQRTQLDAYTFLPFLQLHARQKRPATALLELVAKLQALGIAIPKHHWAVILGAFAAQGSQHDLFYLLDLLEGKPTAQSRALASEEMRAAVDRLSWPEEKTEVGVVAYTSVLAGLQKCGEVQIAKLVRERMGGERLAGELDGRFGVVMRRLTRQGMGG